MLNKDDDTRRNEILSEMVQSFYRFITDKCFHFKTGIPENFKIINFMIKLENYICDHAYSILFCST